MASINPQNLDVTPSLAADDRVMTTNKDGITKTIMGSTLLEFFAEGTTADAPGGAQNKVVTLTDFEGSVLPAQFKINITFTEGNTFGDTTASTPTYPRIILKNKSGAALGTFDVCDSRGHAAGTGCWNNNDFISFKRYGSKLIITNSDVRQAVTSSTNGYTIYSDGRIVYDPQFRKQLSVNNTLSGTGSIQLSDDFNKYKYLELIVRLSSAPTYQQHLFIDTQNIVSGNYIRNVGMDVKFDIYTSGSTSVLRTINYASSAIIVDVYGRY